MAIQFTLRCDLCGATICTSSHSERGLRAEAQLQHGAYCSVGAGDICAGCRKQRQAADADRRRAQGPRAVALDRHPALMADQDFAQLRGNIQTVEGLKRLAKRIKRADGVTHTVALEQAAKRCGFASYADARRTLR